MSTTLIVRVTTIPLRLNVTTVSVDEVLDTVIANIQGQKVLGIGSPTCIA